MRYRLLLLLLPLLFTGCSWISELMLFNKSSQTAGVRIVLTEHDTLVNPFAIKAYKIDKWQDSIPTLGDPTQVYSRREGYSYYVELPSNTALVLAEGMNLDMRVEEQRKRSMNQVKNLNVMFPNDAEYNYTGSDCATEAIALGKGRAGVVIQN